jgi:hypothetical protein
MPDWVDSTVATWLGGEVDAMNQAWGNDGREHLVFVHIPPYVLVRTPCLGIPADGTYLPGRSVIQKLQMNVTSKTNPGLNGI